MNTPSNVTTNNNLPEMQRPIPAAFSFGIIDARNGAPRKVMPALCAAVVNWFEDEIEIDIEREDDESDDDTNTSESVTARTLSALAGDADDEEDEGDDADADEDDTDDEDDDSSDATSYTQQRLVIHVALTPAAVREYVEHTRNDENQDGGELIAQIGYGDDPSAPAFWHTYEIDADDLELIHDDSDAKDKGGTVLARMTFNVNSVTKFNIKD